CGGAIPEVADYRVVADPEGTFIGTLDEDFSVESMAGDIILLGTTSWRIRRIESNGTVRVEDAHGAPPTIPFWLGEAPGRTLELSEEVSKLRAEIAARLDSADATRRDAPQARLGVAAWQNGSQNGDGLPSPAAEADEGGHRRWARAEAGSPLPAHPEVPV